MHEPVHLESPLTDHKLGLVMAKESRAKDVTLSERPILGHINLRGNPGSVAFLHAAEQVLGCKLPLEPNTFIDGNGLRVCWLGPDEWLVICAQQPEGESAENLRRALAGQSAAVTEIGSGQTILALRGPRAREALAKGCALDLHPRVFAPGKCAQSHIARASAMILQTDETPAFEIVVRRSFASYLWLWLTDAAEEFDVAPDARLPHFTARTNCEPLLRRPGDTEHDILRSGPGAPPAVAHAPKGRSFGFRPSNQLHLPRFGWFLRQIFHPQV